MTKTVRPRWYAAIMGLAVLLTAALTRAEDPPPQEWIRQIRPADSATQVVADTFGNIFIAGHTSGNLNGPNAGEADAWFAKYNAFGDQQWIHQFGTSTSDFVGGIAVDDVENLYLSGNTSSSLGGPNAGGSDAFLAKFDVNGNPVWTRQIGTTAYDSAGFFGSVALDGVGGVYLSGSTKGNLGGIQATIEDAFVTKYDESGNRLWLRQMAPNDSDASDAVSSDRNGSIYISGVTFSSLDGQNAGSSDAFVAKYDVEGILLWTRQLGSSSAEWGRSVSVDGDGNVYVTGETYGSLGAPNGGSKDAYLAKYDEAGNHHWTRQLPMSTSDNSSSVVTDRLGNVFIGGHTGFGADARGFVARYNDAGSLRWIMQPDTAATVGSISLDGLGNLYVAGSDRGGGAFLAKFNGATVPEPSALTLIALAAIAVSSRFRRKHR